MKRIWHPFQSWEEFHHGMWGTVPRAEHDRLLPIVVAFTGDAEAYGAAMLRVTREWPISCEHNLTDLDQNRRAWIGHAACCLATGAPEYITREAWGHLTQEQRDRANAKATEAIQEWFGETQNLSLHQEMGRPRISERDSGRSAAAAGAAEQGADLPHDLHGHHEK